MSKHDAVAVRQALDSGVTRYEQMETATGRQITVLVTAEGKEPLDGHDQVTALMMAELCCMRMSMTPADQAHRQRMMAEIEDRITDEGSTNGI